MAMLRGRYEDVYARRYGESEGREYDDSLFEKVHDDGALVERPRRPQVVQP